MKRIQILPKRKALVSYGVAFAIIAAAVLPGLPYSMDVTEYTIESEKIDDPVRIAHISDLHGCFLGENQSELTEAVFDADPDLVLMTGDMFSDDEDEESDENTYELLKSVAGRYPCYYVTGNHESYNTKECFNRRMMLLEEYNVKILSGETETVVIGGTSISICGVDDPIIYTVKAAHDISDQLDNAESQIKENAYSILLAHRPELFEMYSQHSFDLVLSGHAHGGQWRIPFLNGGAYAPNQGLLPEYTGGIYEENGTKMLVSRGLGTTTFVPRLYNSPELAIIDLV